MTEPAWHMTREVGFPTLHVAQNTLRSVQYRLCNRNPSDAYRIHVRHYIRVASGTVGCLYACQKILPIILLEVVWSFFTVGRNGTTVITFSAHSPRVSLRMSRRRTIIVGDGWISPKPRQLLRNSFRSQVRCFNERSVTQVPEDKCDSRGCENHIQISWNGFVNKEYTCR